MEGAVSHREANHQEASQKVEELPEESYHLVPRMKMKSGLVLAIVTVVLATVIQGLDQIIQMDLGNREKWRLVLVYDKFY